MSVPLPPCLWPRALQLESWGLGSLLPPARKDPEPPFRHLPLRLNLQQGRAVRGALMLKLSLPEASFSPRLGLVQTQHFASCLNFTSRGRHIPFCATLIPAEIDYGCVFWVHRFQTLQGASLVLMEGVAQAEASQASLGCLLKMRTLFLPKTERAGSCLLALPHSFLSWKQQVACFSTRLCTSSHYSM